MDEQSITLILILYIPRYLILGKAGNENCPVLTQRKRFPSKRAVGKRRRSVVEKCLEVVEQR